MKAHHTKNKGDIGVLKVKADLAVKGYMILSPETEHAPFDLVAYDGNKFIRVQAKYREMRNGSIAFPFTQSYADRNGSHSIPVDKNSIDIYAIYCPDTDACYYIDPKKFNKAITLRILDSKNGQIKDITFAKDHLDVPVI